MISEGFWRRWFDGAPDVVGRKLVIANTPFTVVGVMPKSFTGARPVERPEKPTLRARGRPDRRCSERPHPCRDTCLVAQRDERDQAGVTLEQTKAALKTV